ncbi:ABC transporter permease [bacterium]|nr:ABC transporter permease [bacterium]
MKRTLAIARKEVFHILRDPRSLMVSVLMPLMMLLLFGYAIDMELRDLPIAILDQDRTPLSREFISHMTSSEFFIKNADLASRDQIEAGFRRSEYRAAIIIPKGFDEKVTRGEESPVQVLVDGADATTAQTVDNYISQVVILLNNRLVENREFQATLLDPRIRFFFNPQLRSADFVVPGLVAVIMMMICALLTSIAVAREKETGTLEQILTTPVLARNVMIGKVMPYMLISAFDAALVLIVGYFVFKVPMAGSWLVLAGYSTMYLLIALSFGLLISSVSKTQQVAMMMALLATLLPTLLLSGFIFSVDSMPLWLQVVCHANPAFYYLKILRGIMLSGHAWYPLEGGIMLGMAIFLMTLAVARFRDRLE